MSVCAAHTVDAATCDGTIGIQPTANYADGVHAAGRARNVHQAPSLLVKHLHVGLHLDEPLHRLDVAVRVTTCRGHEGGKVPLGVARLYEVGRGGLATRDETD